ncbi:MAG: acyl-CoA reductase [Clostridiales bacterium]|nr:acyl-CoA reductase [Clostridiales bacterium]
MNEKECAAVYEALPERLLAARRKTPPDAETVIRACERAAAGLSEAEFVSVLSGLGQDEAAARRNFADARLLLSAPRLRARLRLELGERYAEPRVYTPEGEGRAVREAVAPLGVLLHIAAGNMDALPAFSVLEGLLTGNVNILKLPAADGGLSVRLLSELTRAEPSLADYIYAFEFSSRDAARLRELADLSDAVTVWGGEEAVAALRASARPNIKLIEWGHKISFAYATKAGLSEGALSGLAAHIAETGQVLCSSCQGIFLDTEDTADIYALAERFLPCLKAAYQEKAAMDISVRAKTALDVYCAELDAPDKGRRVYKSGGVSVTAAPDSLPEAAIRFGNLWVKRLPREQILSVLPPYKNYLQTVGLLCGAEERGELSGLLIRAGAVRVCRPERMSAAYPGLPHDGEYALRRYVKIVHTEL